MRNLVGSVCLSTLLATGSVQAESPDQLRIAREMIQVLDAYAVYKMGRYEEAFARYKALAEADNRQGMLNLANMYANGLGTDQDLEQAFAWYRRSAQAGDAISMLEVANAYRLGLGVAADEKEALSWYQRAAEAGEPDAQWQLAKHLITTGLDAEGRMWAEHAAEQGQVDAQQYLHSPRQTGSIKDTGSGSAPHSP